ncbi:hypothetical protein Ri1_27840 [Aeromonas dhakensis]|uniref:Uncharacterized protein n=1 Tax=Aeromonas hydrophila TaxID=644 RepID=A0ABD7G2U7_AERHY|nr:MULTISPECIES: hypothetical protein [Aeromonas]RCF45259.1 hypothetical protein C6C11_19255 [Aeromonas hydrophila]BEJ50185.1 hypothetical protein Ri1_27840 [Aeromonas dhakensis]HDZ8910578.1 hypothetical protein [Aeromonas dhakensis]
MSSEEHLVKLGFKFGKNGAHAARSMMIQELTQLLMSQSEQASLDDYRDTIVDANLLHKSSENARKLTFRHLVDLYGLSPKVPLFKVFRQLWELSEDAQPLLALQLAVARDPLLRGSAEVILPLEPGELLSRETMEAHLAKDDPDRFSPASLKSFSQNLNGTWTQAGYLSGKAKKYRSDPNVTYVNLVFALVLAHYHGLSGTRLFNSFWCKLLAKNHANLFDLAHRATLRGLIQFKQASEVVEVSFAPLKLPELKD